MPIELIKNYITHERLNKMQTALDILNFYNCDYNEIQKIIIKYFKDKPYSLDELNKMVFTHVKYINSIINRRAAGIYLKDAQRIGVKENGDYDEVLPQVLQKLKYDDIVKDALKFSLLFNTVLVGVLINKNIYNEFKLFLEIFTPANTIIKLDASGELELVIIKTKDLENNIFYECWTKYNIVIFDENLNFVNELENAYKQIPFVKLQINKPLNDEFGEPAWDLFINNLILDLKLSDLDYSETFQRNSILIGKNIKLSENQKLEITPRKFLLIDETPGLESKLEYITPNPNVAEFQNLIDWRIKNLYLTNSIANASANLETIAQSGLAKKIDELALIESREELKTKLYYFEKDLMRKIAYIYNTIFDNIDFVGLPIEAKNFDLIFNESQAYETIDEKIKRYEFLKKYNLIDDVDIVMNEFELSETEAIEYIKKRKERMKEIENKKDIDDIINVLTQ